ncbi:MULTISPECIES: diguanylate cyclase domain-containing protein [Corallincola]|uniref:diguanylate cyclase n=3 Tax=Corallincola TaxID=1775176 RepID=A0A368NPR2_9GAMM|nr:MULTISPECIES: diguanylate cyclase [Corallincola]RCU51664.1 diguanylate cyclase [Corallincola holothuriorum]TAA47164.1 diguanylate cyclase [Corallincola spongiicola]TCI04822.1 diguanylate cyclase [Corallincola luteus]
MSSLITKTTVLIVDDEPINIKLLAQALSPRYRVKTSTSGEKALQIAISDDPPDLILLDVLMPEMDGYEVCRQLKQDARSKNTPVVFITGKNSSEDEARGLELGAVDYITKPFNLPIVMARVKNHIALKKKNDLLEQLVFIDGLTEIPNRRRFDELLEAEWLRARRNSTPIAVLLMDIDSFKLFNDNYGHTEGDDCLRATAAALANALRRPADFVARYGGEEFVAIVPEATEDAAVALAEKMRAAVEALQVPHEYSEVASVVTLSVGVAATVPSLERTPEQLIQTADEALYKAKQAGRNRVVSTQC